MESLGYQLYETVSVNARLLPEVLTYGHLEGIYSSRVYRTVSPGMEKERHSLGLSKK